jgi:ketosteroid isomerase-like protein
MAEFSRDEIEDAFQRYVKLQAEQDWSAYCDIFTDDAVYVEHEMGTFVGPQAIHDWLVPTMEPLVGWEYPIQWHVIDEGAARAVCYWLNILPNVDGRAEPYQFAGVTILTYAGDGKWSHQEDIYNMKECEAVMADWFAAGGQLGEA